jgi:hypothetical protein
MSCILHKNLNIFYIVFYRMGKQNYQLESGCKRIYVNCERRQLSVSMQVYQRGSSLDGFS